MASRETNVDFKFRGNNRDLRAVANDSRSLLRGIGREAAAADRSVAASSGRMAKSAGLIGHALKILTVGSVVGLGSIGGAAIGLAGIMGLNFNKIRQSAEIAFTTMLGSGAKARAFLGELQAFAAKTPFEFPDLIKASQRLMAMGFAAKDVIPTLTAVGDAAAALGASGETIDAITRALGQMQNAGRVSAEDMNQLTQAGINGWGYLAKAAGKSIAEVRKLSERGMLDSRVAVQVILAGMQNDFQGMTAKQALTFQGLWSTIKDTISAASGTALRPLFDYLTKKMQALVDFMATPKWTAGVKSLTAWVEDKLVPAIEAMATWLYDNREAFFDAFRQGAHFAALMFNWVGKLGEALGTVAEKLGGWQNAFELAFGALALAKISRLRAGMIGGGAGGKGGGLLGALTLLTRTPWLIPIAIGITFKGALSETWLGKKWNKNNPLQWLSGQILDKLGLEDLPSSGTPGGPAGPNFDATPRPMGGNPLDAGAGRGPGGSGGAVSKATGAAQAALSYQGTKYSFGGGHGGRPGPSGGKDGLGLDCSGLIRAAYAKVNINVAGTAAQLAKTGYPVGLNEMRAGDIIVTRGGGHVILYIGNGQVVAASSASGKVVVQPLSAHLARGNVTAIRRIVAETEEGARPLAESAAAASEAGTSGLSSADITSPSGDALVSGGEPPGGTTKPKGPKKPKVKRGDALLPKSIQRALILGRGTEDARDDILALRAAEKWLDEAISRTKNVDKKLELEKERSKISTSLREQSPDADEMTRSRRGIRAVLGDIDKVISPRLRVSLRNQAREISAALLKVVTPDDASKITARVEKLKERLGESLKLNEPIRVLRIGLGGLANAVSGMPDDARARLAPAVRKLQKQLSGVVSQEQIDTITERMGQIREKINEIVEATQRDVDKKRGLLTEAFSKVADKAFRVFDAQTDRLLKNARAKLAGFTIGEGEETPAERALRQFREDRDAQATAKRRAEIMARIAAAETPEDRASAEAELLGMDMEDRERALERAAEQERKAADEALDRERARITDERALTRDRFQARYDEIVKGLGNEEITATEAQRQIIDLLAEYNVPFAEVGNLLGAAFAEGFTDAMRELQKYVNELTAAINALRKQTGLVPVGGGPVVPPGFGDTSHLRHFDSGGMFLGRRFIGTAQSMRDTLGATVRAGEMVLTADQLIETARTIGGGGGPVINVTMPGAVILSGDRESVEKIVDLLEPAIRRRIQYGG